MENNSEFNILKIDRNSGRERHIYVFLVSFKDLQDFINEKFCKWRSLIGLIVSISKQLFAIKDNLIDGFCLEL